MKIKLCILFIFLIYQSSFCQLSFQKSYGGVNADGANSVIKTTDGGYLVSGWTFTYGSLVQCQTNSYIIKTNSNGDTLWSRAFSADTAGTFINRTIEISSGRYVSLGYIVPTTAVFTDVFVVCFDSNGDTLWSKTYGGPYDDNGYDIIETYDHELAILGSTLSYGDSVQWSTDAYLIKTDSNGNVLWSNAYGAFNAYPGYEWTYSIKETVNKDLVISGMSSSFSADHRGQVYVVKMDNFGTVKWSKTYDLTNRSEASTAMFLTSDGGLVLGGYWQDINDAMLRALLLRTDSTGNVMWIKTYEQTWLQNTIKSIQETPNGNFYICGDLLDTNTWKYSGYISKIKNNGDTIWNFHYCPQGYNCECVSLDKTNDGGLIAAGYIIGSSTDFYLVKLDSLGLTGCEHRLVFVIDSPLVTTSNVATYAYSLNEAAVPLHGIIGYGALVSDLCFPDGISQVVFSAMNIYPNPSSQLTKINCFLTPTSIRVTNILGKDILFQLIGSASNEISLDISDLENGIYFITVTSGGQSTTQKLIVQH